MDSKPKWRLRARAALEAYFRKRSHPRFILGLLVTIAGMVGFLISYVLLHRGIVAMWLRYPVAVIGGYITFIALLRFWVEIERDRYDPKEVEISTDLPDESTSPPHKKFISDSGSWLDWLDVPGLFDFGEGCLIGCLITIIIGALAGVGSLLFSFIMAGPELLAEVFLDAVVVTMFYRHLKTAAREHWLGTAVKRTWHSALLIAGALSLIGGCLAVLAPHSHSIGTALKEIFHRAGSM
jgi:hypothetical protein